MKKYLTFFIFLDCLNIIRTQWFEKKNGFEKSLGFEND
jgi:hypothetical protein